MKDILTILLLMVTALHSSGIFAGYINDITSREVTRRDDFVKSITKEQRDFIYQKEMVKRQIKNYQGVVEKIKTRKIQNKALSGLTKKPQAIVFVSLGMPDLSLRQIIQDAERYQIPVVIRGLYENSFRKTAEKIFNLAKEKNNGGILINPLWFKEYDIKVVPAVVVNNGGGDTDTVFDVLYGNIHLKRALSIIAERGDVSSVAKGILNKKHK